MSLCHEVNTHSPTFCAGLAESHSSWPADSTGSSGVTKSPLSMFLPRMSAGELVSTVVAVTQEKIDISQVPCAHGVDVSQNTGPWAFVITAGMPLVCSIEKYSQYSCPRSSSVLPAAVTPLTSRQDQRTPAGVKCGRRSSIEGP